jgi:hypothetical protein
MPDAKFMGTPLLFPVLINNVKVITTFDSGADLSVIPQKLADKLQLLNDKHGHKCMANIIVPETVYFKSIVGNHRVKCTETLYVYLTYNNRMMRVRFVIDPSYQVPGLVCEVTTKALFDQYLMHEDGLTQSDTRETFHQDSEDFVPPLERECTKPHQTVEPLAWQASVSCTSFIRLGLCPRHNCTEKTLTLPRNPQWIPVRFCRSNS